MSDTFKVGDRVRLTGADTYIGRWPHIYSGWCKGKVGEVIRLQQSPVAPVWVRFPNGDEWCYAIEDLKKIPRYSKIKLDNVKL